MTSSGIASTAGRIVGTRAQDVDRDPHIGQQQFPDKEPGQPERRGLFSTAGLLAVRPPFLTSGLLAARLPWPGPPGSGGRRRSRPRGCAIVHLPPQRRPHKREEDASEEHVTVLLPAPLEHIRLVAAADAPRRDVSSKSGPAPKVIAIVTRLRPEIVIRSGVAGNGHIALRRCRSPECVRPRASHRQERQQSNYQHRAPHPVRIGLRMCLAESRACQESPRAGEHLRARRSAPSPAPRTPVGFGTVHQGP